MKFTLKNNELTATRKLDFFESLIMEAIKAEDDMPQEAQEDVRKGVYYLLERLDGEIAKAFGVLAVNAGDETLDNFLTSYFGNLVSALFGLRTELKI